MADDNHDRENSNTVRLDTREIEELTKLPGFPDREEFLQTQEMDSMSADEMTDPSRSALETTQRWSVPDDLLELATRSQELSAISDAYDDHDWGECVAVVDPRGRIHLPARVHGDLIGKKVRVKYRIDE